MKFVTQEQAQALLKKGWKAADLHVHTSHSFDVIPVAELDPQNIYAKAKQRGMSFVCFTDHDTMAAYEHFHAEDVVRGVEISILDKKNVGHTVDINVYCLSRAQFLELEYIANKERDIYKFIAYCKKHDLPFQYNHPYWTEVGERCNHKSVEKIAKHFPLIELNLGRVKLKNDLALALAKKHGKQMLANTDTHTGDVGYAYTLAQGRTFREWWRNVEKGRAVVVRRNLTMSYMIAEVNRRINEVFAKDLREKDLAKFKKGFTGVKIVDYVVRAMIIARRYRIGRFVLRNIMLLLSHTRLPAAIYLHNELKQGKELRQAIETTSGQKLILLAEQTD